MNLNVVILNAFTLVAVLSVFMMYLLFFVISRQVKMDISLNKRKFHNDLGFLGNYNHLSKTNKNEMNNIINNYQQKATHESRLNEDWNANLYQQSIWLTALLFLLMIAYSYYGISIERFNANTVLQTFIVTSIIVIITHIVLYHAIMKDYKHAQLEILYNTVLQNFLSTNSSYKPNSSGKQMYCDSAL